MPTRTAPAAKCRYSSEQILPVRRDRGGGGFLPFVLEGHHSVGTQVPGPGLDLIERKLKKILLRDKKAGWGGRGLRKLSTDDTRVQMSAEAAFTCVSSKAL